MTYGGNGVWEMRPDWDFVFIVCFLGGAFVATEFLGVCKRCVLVLHYNNPASVFPLLLLTIVGLHRVGLRSFFFSFFLPSAALPWSFRVNAILLSKVFYALCLLCLKPYRSTHDYVQMDSFIWLELTGV